MSDTTVYKEHFRCTSSDRPEHVDVETSRYRVVGEHPVEVIIKTRLVKDPARSLADTERLINAAAIAALQ